MADVFPLVAAAGLLGAAVLLLSMYWKLPKPCRGGGEVRVGRLVVCGGRGVGGGVEVWEGWLYNTSLFGHAEFSIEGLPCTFKLGGDVLVVKCERPIRVRP